MKFLKISDDVHEKLKVFCEDKKFFMKDWLEYIITENIEKNVVNMNEKLLEDFGCLLNLVKTNKETFEQSYIDFVPNTIKDKKEYFEFTVDGDNIEDIIFYLNKNMLFKYYNLVGYNNVTDINIEPENKEGVIQYLGLDINDKPIFKAYNTKSSIKDNISYKNKKYNTFNFTDNNININVMKEMFEMFPDNNIEIGGIKNTIINIINQQSFTINSKPDNYVVINATKRIKLGSLYGDIENKLYNGFFNHIKESCNANINNNDYKPIILDLSIIEGDSYSEYLDNVKEKLKVKLSHASSMIAINSFLGQATHVILPSKYKYLIDKDIDKDVDVDVLKNDYIEYLGIYENFKLFISDFVDDIYIYRINKNTHGLNCYYSFDKCNLDEIKISLIKNGENCNNLFYKISIIDKPNVNLINKNIENKLSKYSFLELNNKELPYKLPKNEITLFNNGVSNIENELESLIINDTINYLFSICDYLPSLKIGTRSSGDDTFKINLFKLILDNAEYNKKGFIICNSFIGNNVISECKSKYFTPNKNIEMNNSLYNIGKLGLVDVYICPFISYSDNKILRVYDNITIDYNNNILKKCEKIANNILLEISKKVNIEKDNIFLIEYKIS